LQRRLHVCAVHVRYTFGLKLFDMLVWSNETNKYVIDPHYLNIIPFRKIWDADKHHRKEIAEAKLLWIYHRYNPHSPFKDYKNSEKSRAIVLATFPKWFLDEKEKGIQALIDDAIAKNKDIDELNLKALEGKEEEDKKKIKQRDHVFVPTLRLYDPEDDETLQDAITWYTGHLKQTSLWAAVDSYKEGIYNLSKIISNPNSTPLEIKTASIELDQLPARMERMRQQAIKDEAQTLKVSGDKNIKKRERTVGGSSSKKQVVS